MVWEDQGEGVGSASLLSIQEKSGLGDEQFWVLELRAMTRVRVQDELRVGNVLLQRE